MLGLLRRTFLAKFRSSSSSTMSSTTAKNASVAAAAAAASSSTTTAAATSSESKQQQQQQQDGLAYGFNPAKRLQTFLEPTVWHKMTPMAMQHQAINLGQGFPGWSSPEFVKKALVEATTEKTPGASTFLANQYARSGGHLMLCETLAATYSERFNRKVDAQTEVQICNGATGVIFNITQSLLNPGDEVVMFEPAFDIYIAQAEMCGAVVKPVPLFVRNNGNKKKENNSSSNSSSSSASAASSSSSASSGGEKAGEGEGEPYWDFDLAALERAFSNKTRLFILNTPHNPTGKVFTREELAKIAAIVAKFPNCVVLSDEVYEHLTYDGHKHVSIASLPGMYERTITCSSAGKTFSCTGWKIGWAVGPAHLIRCVGISNSWVCFSVHTSAQIAIASCLQQAQKAYDGAANGGAGVPSKALLGAASQEEQKASALKQQHESYYAFLQHEYTRKRDFMLRALTDAGLKPVKPHGSFFIMADTSSIEVPAKWIEASKQEGTRDWAVARYLTCELGVACIPPTAFFCDANKKNAESLIRFAFCQSDDTLAEAAKRLAKLTAK